MEERTPRRRHFLLVTYPAQGHINPAIHLAKSLARAAGADARITFSTAVSAHRKMFPNLSSPDDEVEDGAISYVPFSDGYDEGFRKGIDDMTNFFSRLKTVSSQNLSSVLDRLDSRGQRVDCVIYTFMVSWAAQVACSHGIVSAQYWIQPATVFAVYYHAFRGYDELIAAHSKDPFWTAELPGLQPLQICELPSFLTTVSSPNDLYYQVLTCVKEAFLASDDEKPRKNKPTVLVNTFEEIESDAFLSVAGGINLVGVGPILQSFPNDNTTGFHLFKPDQKDYMEWLDSKLEKSVVYVSFGSLTVLRKEQMGEILKGLKASGRPYLWVVRKDCRYEGDGLDGDDENGMIVEWCSQVRVLRHPSVGCFVTHCGWNSTLESIAWGMPVVAMPQWTDQGTNAMLVEKVWRMGVRGEVNVEGFMEGDELKKCLDLVLGDGERGKEIRKNAQRWKEKAIEAVGQGGSSDCNLRAFVGERE